MAIGLLHALAAKAPVPVFPALGAGGEALIGGLYRDPEIVLVDSIRHAAILLVAGMLRGDDHAPLQRLHDQMPHPRATLWCGDDRVSGFDDAIRTDADPAQALRTAFAELISGNRASEPDILPDEPPAPWRGKGKNGQGGDGMMGGVPYGRPMAMTDKDLRDGLALDSFSLCIGPFLQLLPPGLMLELTLQGDVIQTARVVQSPYPVTASSPAMPDTRLRQVARMLNLLGLPALAARCHVGTGRFDLSALRRKIVVSGAFAAIPHDLGAVGNVGARDRFRTMLDSIQNGSSQNPSGHEPSGDTATGPIGDPVTLASLLPGLEWGEAMLVINSFDPGRWATMARRDAPASDEAAHGGTTK